MKNRKSIATLDFFVYEIIVLIQIEIDWQIITIMTYAKLVWYAKYLNQAYIKNKIGSTIHFSNLVLASAVGIK